ncbi:hypothetical protein M405DRAFT_807489 [Rhizopogon salebrosus TDB-379]|nr:hypothetical protein M405DRAFT_807489 [Rhizopogon salebrosus TDB-379]
MAADVTVNVIIVCTPCSIAVVSNHYHSSSNQTILTGSGQAQGLEHTNSNSRAAILDKLRYYFDSIPIVIKEP